MKFFLAFLLSFTAVPSFAGWNRTPAVADTTILQPQYYAVKIEEGRRLVVAHIEVDSISGLNYWDLDTLDITHLKINSADETAYLNITADDNVNDRDGSLQAAIEMQPSGTSSFPSIFFGGQSSDRYSGIVWTNSTSGNAYTQIRASIIAIPAGADNTSTALLTYINDNAGSSGSAIEIGTTLDGATGNFTIGRSVYGSRRLHVVDSNTSPAQYAVARFAVNATGAGTESGIEFYSDDDGTPKALGFISGREQTGSLESLYFTANSVSQGMFLYDDGNLSVGKDSTAQKLTVNGVIESLTGGFKFPDGTIQTTAGGGGGGGGGSNVLTAADGTPSQAVYVNNENDVGIGTSTPNLGAYDLAVTISAAGSPSLSSAWLEIQSTGSALGTYSGIDFYDDSQRAAVIVPLRDRDNNSSSIGFYTSRGGTIYEAAKMDTNQNLVVGGFSGSNTGIDFPGALSATGFRTYASSAYGLVGYGYGVTSDILLANQGGMGVIQVPAGTRNTYLGGKVTINQVSGTFDGTMDLTVSGVEGASGGIALWADDGDDSPDKFNIYSGTDGYLYITGNGAYSPGDLILSSSGLFGINTTPSYQFHVKGDGQASVLEPETSTLHTFQRVTNAGAGLNIGVEGVAGGTIASGTSAYSGVIASSVSGTKLHLASEGVTTLTIDDDQEVGIGTTTPQEILDVVKSQNGATRARFTNSTDGTASSIGWDLFGPGGRVISELYAPSYTTSGKYKADSYIIETQGGTDGGFILSHGATTGNMEFWVGSSEALTIDQNENVGLSNSSPSSRLDLTIAVNPGVFAEFENTLASQADLQLQSRGSGDAGIASTGNLTLDAGATLGTAATTTHFQLQSDGSIWLEGNQRFDGSSRLVPHTVASTTTFTNLNADLLDGYNTAAAATASTVPVRDGSGRLKAADPSAADDVATKNYVDGIASADGHSLNAADGLPVDQIYIDNDGNTLINSLTRFTSGGALVPHTVSSTSVFTNLNADLLDGVSEASFARLDQSETVTGTWTFGNNVSASGYNFTLGTGSLIGNSRSLVLNQATYPSVAAELKSADASNSSIRLLDSTSSFRSWLFGDGTSQGFLNSTGSWVVRWNNGTLATGTVPTSQVSGTLPAAQVQDGTGTGLDADLLDGQNGATTGSASTVMIRDGAGRSQVAEPSASSDIATKNYVDTQVAAAAGSLGPWNFLDTGRTADATAYEASMAAASSATQLLIAVAGTIIEPVTEDDWVIYGLTSKGAVNFAQRDTIGVTDGIGGKVIGWVFEGNSVLETKTSSSIDLSGTILLDGSDCTLRWDYQNDLFEIARNGGECAIAIWYR